MGISLAAFDACLKSLYSDERIASILYPRLDRATETPSLEATEDAGAPMAATEPINIATARARRDAKRRQLLEELDIGTADRIAALRGGR